MSAKYLVGTMTFVSMLALLFVLEIALPDSASARDNPHRFIVTAKSKAEHAALKAEVLRLGGKVVIDQPSLRMLAVTGPESLKATLAKNSRTQSVAKDKIVQIIPTTAKADFGFNEYPQLKRTTVDLFGSQLQSSADPGNSLRGLFWNFDRIHTQEAWKTTRGDHAVKVGVADTGLDYTHAELAGKVEQVVDLTETEDPPLCKTYYGYSDSDYAAAYGGPADADWNGHGTWIGGNIAAVLDSNGINGIAPDVGLVGLKIAQWCGSAYSSTIANAFVYAADHDISIVNVSFGGYSDLSDPDDRAEYDLYVNAVNYAYNRGTLIVASAGNDHLRIGKGGVVLSHGPLTNPTVPFVDYYGLYQRPGGIPLVVNVAATNNLVNSPSPSCPDDTTGTNATCKPASDAHKPFGVGKEDQLAYYSNYGPRIDIAAPGGARKFNLPVWDRGGSGGYPVTDEDGTKAWGTFSITSNWAMEIPCYWINAPGIFPSGQCYANIQGTSMAAPHVAAVAALIASTEPGMRRDPKNLTLRLKNGANKNVRNYTPPLSATDRRPGDLSGDPCDHGYCHLGGAAIPNAEAYGSGVLNAYRPL